LKNADPLTEYQGQLIYKNIVTLCDGVRLWNVNVSNIHEWFS